MDEQRKSLEAVGDGLLLAVARLYLHDRRADVPYKVHSRINSLLVKNSMLAVIAEGEGIEGKEGERLADAFEIAVTLHYFRYGFKSLRIWLFRLFDKYLNVAEEVKRILEPAPEDALTKSIRGALKMVIGQNGGKITGSTLDLVTRQVVQQLRNGNGTH